MGGLPWIQGENRGWYDSCLLDQEQERQDREQEKVGVWQEERLDCCRHQGKEGIGSQGLCRNQEGLCLYKKSAWIAAVTKARKALGLKGFVAIKKGSVFIRRELGLLPSPRQGRHWVSRALSQSRRALSLQEGQGALPMNMHEHAKASAQGVGMSTPLERRCVGWTVSLVLSTIDE